MSPPWGRGSATGPAFRCGCGPRCGVSARRTQSPVRVRRVSTIFSSDGTRRSNQASRRAPSWSPKGRSTHQSLPWRQMPDRGRPRELPQGVQVERRQLLAGVVGEIDDAVAPRGRPRRCRSARRAGRAAPPAGWGRPPPRAPGGPEAEKRPVPMRTPSLRCGAGRAGGLAHGGHRQLAAARPFAALQPEGHRTRTSAVLAWSANWTRNQAAPDRS